MSSVSATTAVDPRRVDPFSAWPRVAVEHTISFLGVNDAFSAMQVNRA